MQNTKNVVDFIVSSRLEAIPGQALAVAKDAIQDCVGVALAGARQPAGAIPAEWARKAAGTGAATVWGQDFKTTAHDAALVNGTAAHALDYDDVTWGLIGHPSVSLVPPYSHSARPSMHWAAIFCTPMWSGSRSWQS